jgi:hypothetical protein
MKMVHSLSLGDDPTKERNMREGKEEEKERGKTGRPL